MRELIKIKNSKNTNRGNRTPRTRQQIVFARARMIFNNPMKKPFNRTMQSMRMMENKRWMFRKTKIIKQQPSL